MNTLKNVLAGLAFVFAIGAAYASTNSYYPVDQAEGIYSLGGCILGVLDHGRVRGTNPVDCWTTITSKGRCTVTVFYIWPESVAAFDPYYGVCLPIDELYIQE